jgi:hypothetical protein
MQVLQLLGALCGRRSRSPIPDGGLTGSANWAALGTPGARGSPDWRLVMLEPLTCEEAGATLAL